MTARELLKIVNFYARFTPSYTRIGYYARHLNWARSPVPDLAGRHWLVTGASQGIGKAMALYAARAGATVTVVARSAAGLEALRDELPGDAAGRLWVAAADMSLQSGTQALLDGLLAADEPIDVLINNVGVLCNELQVTAEGREASYVTNILSHFQLTEGLLHGNLFRREAAIVNMTSGGMYNAPLGCKLLNVTDPARFNGKVAYAYAKRAQVALTAYWERAGRDRGIRSYVTHPGWVRTPGVQKSLPVFWKLQYPLLRSPLQGADTALWLCRTRPENPPEGAVWFDRQPRPLHMYEFTRQPECTLEELVEYLRNDLGPTHHVDN